MGHPRTAAPRLPLPLLLAVLVGALWGCPSDPPDDAVDIYQLPDASDGWYDDGLIEEVDPAAFLNEGADCSDGVFECRWDLGCVDDRCGACETADDCRDNQGCVGGVCGECSVDGDCSDGDACVETFCMPAQLPKWDLEIDPVDLAAMNQDPWADLWAPARLTVDGTIHVADVRARFLGASTRSLPKKSFRIWFPEDADHPGFQRKINLRAEFNDPSTRRNFMAHETFRRFTRIPTPRTRYVDFSLNGDEMGVMLEVERIGGKFLNRNGRDREQPMYELARTHPYGAFVPLDSEEDYAATYAKTTGDEFDWSDLYTLIEDVMWQDWTESSAGGPTTTARLGEVFDLPNYTRYLAVMALLQSQEHVTQNFYFSHQDRGQGPKWEIYPWDLDLTLGCKWNAVEGNPMCTEDPVTEGWWLEGVVYRGLPVGSPETCWCNMGINLTLFDPVWGSEFQAQVCELLDDPWWTTRGPAYVSALGTMLAPYVADDPTDRNDSLADFDAAGERVTEFMAARAAYLREQVGCF